MGHPEAGSDGVRGPLRRDLQRRQQEETLHSDRDDRVPGAGAAGERAHCLGFWDGCKHLSMKWTTDPDGEPYGFSHASNVLYIGRELYSPIKMDINQRCLPYADRDKDLVSVYMD